MSQSCEITWAKQLKGIVQLKSEQKQKSRLFAFLIFLDI